MLKTIQDCSASELDKVVNKHLTDGWKILSISTAATAHTVWLTAFLSKEK